MLVQVRRIYFWLLLALQQSKLSLKRLRIIIFGKPKKRRRRDSDSDGDSAMSDHRQPAEGLNGDSYEPAHGATTELSETGETDGESDHEGQRRGHGRLGIDA